MLRKIVHQVGFIYKIISGTGGQQILKYVHSCTSLNTDSHLLLFLYLRLLISHGKF